MSAAPPAPSVPGMATEPETSEPTRHRNVWIWISGLLVAVAIGVFVWGLTVKTDLDGTQEDLDQANAQVTQLKAADEKQGDAADALMPMVKSAYESLTEQLGVATDDLAATTAELEAAQAAADAATTAAAAAKEKAGQAKDAIAKIEAEAAAARADAEVARTKATVVADCAKAGLSVLGELFDGGLATVQQTLQSIASDCKTALAGI
jgi:hypothetical protein